MRLDLLPSGHKLAKTIQLLFEQPQPSFVTYAQEFLHSQVGEALRWLQQLQEQMTRNLIQGGGCLSGLPWWIHSPVDDRDA